ncbi:MAG TPA: hypothetical protein VKT28_20740 [Puia sp.]|nr:hypothetical protein [Puia sp.]
MLSRKKGMVAFVALLISMNACIKSNQPIYAGSGFCDTTNVTYAKNVVPILESYCYPCHSNNNAAFSNGISLEGYNNTRGWIDGGYLIGNIRHDPGFIGMPYGKPKLSDCEINTILAWVHQGFQQ